MSVDQAWVIGSLFIEFSESGDTVGCSLTAVCKKGKKDRPKPVNHAYDSREGIQGNKG